MEKKNHWEFVNEQTQSHAVKKEKQVAFIDHNTSQSTTTRMEKNNTQKSKTNEKKQETQQKQPKHAHTHSKQCTLLTRRPGPQTGKHQVDQRRAHAKWFSCKRTQN